MPKGFGTTRWSPCRGNYREGFHFSKVRTSSDIGSDQLGEAISEDEADAQRYPYLTCEVGGGMMNAYHRRVLIDAPDVVSTALVKFGSGGNLLGYYMYHGGWNPEGTYSTLQESLETHYPNDMPVKNYDFQAPVGAAGTLRRHYHELRQMHLFMRDYPEWIASLKPQLPEKRPSSLDDTQTLRWSARCDGSSGLVFFNNYQRLQTLADHDVQFRLDGLEGGPLVFPSRPVHLKSGDLGYWPFRWEMVPGVTVEWITAQPICKVQDAEGDWVVFVKQTGSVPVELGWMPQEGINVLKRNSDAQWSAVEQDESLLVIDRLQIGDEGALCVEDRKTGRKCSIVVLSETGADQLWKGSIAGHDLVLMTDHEVIFKDEGFELRYSVADSDDVRLIADQVPEQVFMGVEKKDAMMTHHEGSLWTTFALPPVQDYRKELPVEFDPIRPHGDTRDIPLGSFKSKVAMAPVERDFSEAAVWGVSLPAEDLLRAWDEWVLQVDYRADTLRFYANDVFCFDDFFNGRPVELALKPLLSSHGIHAAELPELQLKLLPLDLEHAPIYLHPDVSANLSQRGTSTICELQVAKWILRNPLAVSFEW